MANFDGAMESSRELVLKTRSTIEKLYAPPPINQMPYFIKDRQLHCTYFFKNKRKFNKALKRFKKNNCFDSRFICKDSK